MRTSAHWEQRKTLHANIASGQTVSEHSKPYVSCNKLRFIKTCKKKWNIQKLLGLSVRWLSSRKTAQIKKAVKRSRSSSDYCFGYCLCEKESNKQCRVTDTYKIWQAPCWFWQSTCETVALPRFTASVWRNMTHKQAQRDLACSGTQALCLSVTAASLSY